jgi:hypothetical protein
MEERFFSPVGEKVRSQKRRKERRGQGKGEIIKLDSPL